MADPKIRIRRSATPNKVPSTTQLQLGELAINTYDGKVYLEQDQGGVGVGTTVIAINPWSVGIGSTAYNTHFLSGKAGIGTTNAQYNLDVGGNINFTGNLYQDGSLYTSGTTGVGIKTAGGIVGYAATIIDFRGPGVTTAYYSSATGIGTVYFQGGGGGGGGNASVTVSDSAPSSPSNGDLWFKSDVGELYLWYTDGSSNQWVEASGGSNTVVTSDTPPASPNDGDLWWNSNTGELKVYYNDGNSSQWVDATSGGFHQYWYRTNTNGILGVTTTGYVGIGTTTATDALTVVGATDLDGTLLVSGVSTFSGDVKIGGVLTYEDVKNVDAIGVVTARTGIKVLAGGANIVDGTTTDELNVTGIATVVQLKATTVNVTGVSTVTGGVKVGTAATICSEGNMTIDRPSAGIITATKFIGDGSELTGVISGIGIGTAGGVVGYAATIVHFKGPGVTTAYYSSTTGVGTVYFQGGGGGGSANVTIADAPPGSPSAGDLWWESDIGELKIYYNDGNSSQWVDASGADSLVQIGTSAPTGAVSGDLWWNSESGDLMVYYTDANSSAWISVNAVNSERIWSTNSTGIHTSRSVGIGTTTVTDPLTVVGATDLDGTLIVSGITTFGSHVYHGDNDRAIFGDGSDLEIYHSGTKSIINDAGTGSLELQVGGSTKLETTVGGAKVWGTVGSANTALVVVGDARVTGIITVGTGSLKITDRDINMVGVITGANFKSGTTNVHNVGVEAAGINVLGADTPIGTGATVYNSGVIVSKQGAEFQGVVTASNFDGNITLPGNDIITRNLKVTGLSTFVGNAQFNANVNILGTLTYEDVKNVDSVGIATARQGLRITGGGLNVVGVSTFNDNVLLLDDDRLRIGSSQDLDIYHSSSNSFIHNNTGRLRLESDNLGIGFYKGAGAATLATFNVDAECSLRYNNQLKFETMDSGVKVSGITSTTNLNVTGISTLTGIVKIGTNTAGRAGADELTIGNASGDIGITLRSGTSNEGNIYFADSTSSGNAEQRGIIRFDHSTDSLQFFTANGNNWPTEKLRLTSAGLVGIGTDTPNAFLDIGNLAGGSTPGLHVINHTAAGSFSGNYGSEFRHAFGSVNHAMLIHTQEAADSRRVLDISDSNGIFATFTNGKLGINTTMPDGKLEINAPGSAHMLMFSNNGTNFAQLGYNSASGTAILDVRSEGHTRFLTGGNNERLRIRSDGRITTNGETGGDVAIGGIHIKTVANASTSTCLILENHGTDTNTAAQLKFVPSDASPADRYNAITSLDVDGNNKFDMIFTTCAGGTPVDRLRITNDGQILLAGATTSTAHADADDLVLNERSGGNVGITFKNSGTGFGVIYFADNSAQHSGRIQYDHSNDTLDLFTGGSERVNVNNGGITVSGSGIFGSANTSKDVNGCVIERNSGDGLVHIAACRTGGNYSGLNFYVAGNSGGSGANTKLRHLIDYQGNFKWYASDGTTERLHIKTDGDVDFTSTTGNSTFTFKKGDSPSGEETVYARFDRNGTVIGGVGGAAMLSGGESGNNMMLATVNNGHVVFGTGNGGVAAPRMRIRNDGHVIIDTPNNGYSGLKIYDDTSGDYNVRYIAGRNQSATAHVFMDSGRNQGATPWTDATPAEAVRLSRAKGIQFQGDTDTWFGASGADGLKWQTEGTDVAYMTKTQVFATAKHNTKVTGYSPITTRDFGHRCVTKFFMEYYTGNSSATYHFCRQISQPDWSFDDMEIKQHRSQYSPAGNDKATRRYYTWYGSHTEQITNYNQNGSTSGGNADSWIGKNQNLGPGGAFKIHEAANGGYYRDAWATDYYVSLGNYIGVRLEITIWSNCGLYDTGTYATASNFYPAAFGGQASQSDANNWGGPRGTWFNTTAQGTGTGSSPGCLDPWGTGSVYGQTADP